MSEPQPGQAPRRLADQDAAAAALLGAARGYRASSRARHRVLRMLGLPVALSLVGAASPAAGAILSALSNLSVKAWLIVGTMAAAGGGGAVVAYRGMNPEPAAPSPAIASAAQPRTRVLAPTSLPEPEPPPLAAAPPRRTLPPVRGPSAPARRRAPAQLPAARALAPVPVALPPPTPPPPSLPPPVLPQPLPLPSPVASPAVARPGAGAAAPGTTLGRELALIDGAEMALRRGAPQQALDLLGQHRRQFPAGNLREEAAVLSIDAQLRSGRWQAARHQARRFLVEHADSVLAARVRAMMSEAQAAPQPVERRDP
jgi:hypothetical protein